MNTKLLFPLVALVCLISALPALAVGNVVKLPVSTLAGVCYMDRLDNEKSYKRYWSGKCRKNAASSMDLVDGDGILWVVSPDWVYIHIMKGSVSTKPNSRAADGFITDFFGIAESVSPKIGDSYHVKTFEYGDDFVPGDYTASKLGDDEVVKLPDWAVDADFSITSIKHPILAQLIKPDLPPPVTAQQTPSTATQDCSVLNGTWKTTFTNATTGKGSVLDWKWQVNGDRVVTELHDLQGKLLGSSPIDKCSVSGNTVNYQTLNANGQINADVRLQLGTDHQSFSGTGFDKKDGASWKYTGQRVGVVSTGTPGIKLDEGVSAVVDLDNVGTSRSFSFKTKKK